MKILIIGSNGFIAKNLISSLENTPNISLIKIKNKKDNKKLFQMLSKVDVVFHLAGVIRSYKQKDFIKNNFLLTKKICNTVIKLKLNLKFFYTSTVQTGRNNFYGVTKKKAEDCVLYLKKKTSCSVYIYNLPNIFGKGCKPFHNSAIATFCYQIARNKKVLLKNKKKILNLLYIDDLVNNFKNKLLIKKKPNCKFIKLPNTYKVSVAKIYKILISFQNNEIFIKQYHQKGLLKKLFATYVSYLPPYKTKSFINGFQDSRGSFYEILKSKTMGQISFLTIKPGEIRGNHYHNTKVELFFLVSGIVKINTQNIFNKKKYSFTISSGEKIPTTITQPGFAHNIVNIGKTDAKLVIWSNEIYNIKKPDTHVFKLSK